MSYFVGMGPDLNTTLNDWLLKYDQPVGEAEGEGSAQAVGETDEKQDKRGRDDAEQRRAW